MNKDTNTKIHNEQPDFSTQSTQSTQELSTLDYTFIKAPKEIITGDIGKNLSASAKLLYIALIDRLSMSIRNGWKDKNGNTYIIYTSSEAKKLLSCSNEKMAKIWSELEGKNGIALIKRKRQGVGKPFIIYVLTQKWKTCKKESYEEESSAPPSFENRISCDSQIETAEIRKSNTNNINYNKNNINYINSICQSGGNSCFEYTNTKQWIEDRQEINSFVKDSIGYDILEEDCNMGIIDDIVNVMTEVIASDEEFLKIGGQQIPRYEVKKRMYEISYEHILYVHDSLLNVSTNIINMRAYLLTALYRSTETINCRREIRN